ncbi:amino-acid N-acetyltransferase [Leucobacter allii]|uniref:Amino-acid N-acetyltransferase n=1 Tax=Leucobacter allii TaxID=2932247 RepID=A0ABY4FJQ5_9MICO|nr:amino-acid N-acetyltransferase [Leucobacter allii]UOQ56262.1 amino-acid N-acetyltransferase [Leucobacter allii]UOR00730.1 amino-acid N-acetyltransferase [Leucobacter allii]
MSEPVEIRIRTARTGDVPRMVELMDPLVSRRILLGKDLVELYGAVPEFLVATTAEDVVIGYGAVHVMWEQLGEVRTLGVSEEWLGRGVGHRLLEALEERARALGLTQLFCLTFETAFFGRHGFDEVGEDAELVAADVYAELLRSNDEGVAEFLDLARVKPNTLGNTRMLKRL